MSLPRRLTTKALHVHSAYIGALVQSKLLSSLFGLLLRFCG